MKKWIGYMTAVFFMTMLFAACTGDGEKRTERTVVEVHPAVSEKGENAMTIIMTSGDTAIEAVLNDTPMAKEFAGRLPMTLSMRRFDDREYYARIPELQSEGRDIRDYENGDVTYYRGGPSFAVFFAKAGTSHQSGLVRLGKVTSDLSLFDHLGAEETVKIEIKK